MDPDLDPPAPPQLISIWLLQPLIGSLRRMKLDFLQQLIRVWIRTYEAKQAYLQSAPPPGSSQRGHQRVFSLLLKKIKVRNIEADRRVRATIPWWDGEHFSKKIITLHHLKRITWQNRSDHHLIHQSTHLWVRSFWNFSRPSIFNIWNNQTKNVFWL